MPDSTSGEFRDVSDLGLPGVQQQLVEAVVDTGTPTVVVVVSGRAHALPWIAENVPALVYAWVPGERGGAAIADVLFGVESPSGRLPISLPRGVGHVPIHHDHRAGGGRSQIFGDYADAPASPLFAFGAGLTYTTFEYDALRTDEAATTTAPFEVEVRVRNRGDRTGTEVVQLFLRDEVARVARPDRQLVGFARVELAPGESATVGFTVDPSLLAYYDEAMKLVIEPGDIRAIVGGLEQVVAMGGPEREIEPNDRRPTTADWTVVH
jgi:beta-glucosidase